MRDEASLARLEEMGFAVYMPRGERSARLPVASPQAAAPSRDTRPRTRVVLLAREESKAARTFVAGVMRALAFARIDGDVATAIDEHRLRDAKGLIAFGDEFAREAGIQVSAARQTGLAWVATTDADAIARQPAAKRALWSELKRLARSVRAPTS
jgi:hypothetical protein